MNTMWLDLLGSQVRFYGKQFKTRAVEAGEGDLLVLIHGVGGHAEAYSRNVTRLGKYYRTMAIDLLWHGLSAKPPYNHRSVSTYADQIVDLLDSLGIERVHIEGESLGGWVGLWFALHHPGRLGKLILNTTAGVAYDSVKLNDRPEEGRDLLRRRSMEAIENPNRETIRKRLEWLMASPDRVTEELVELRYRMYADLDTRRALKDVFSNSFGDGDSKTFRISAERLKEIKAPTLVLWTEKNPGAGPEVGQYIRSLIPGAAYACIPDAAHWPQWEHPEEHDEIVLKFLKGEP